MTAEIINLRQYRKQKAKAEKSRRADENRRRHGRTKGERLSEDDGIERQSADLDGKKLEPDSD